MVRRAPPYIYLSRLIRLIDEQGYLKTALLGLPRVLGGHHGVNVATYLINVIQEYGFEENIGAVMMDNARDNDTCVRALAEVFNIDEKRTRLRCGGHIINLVCKALLYGKGVTKFQKALLGASDLQEFEEWRTKGSIGKLHNLVVYIDRSNERRQAFSSSQEVARLKGEKIFIYQLLKDGGIRWNSTYSMIERGKKILSYELYFISAYIALFVLTYSYFYYWAFPHLSCPRYSDFWCISKPFSTVYMLILLYGFST